MTHFGLGSSGEDPRGSLLGRVGLPTWEPALPAWEAALFPWEAWGALSLAECLEPCLPDLVCLPAWPEGGLLPAWEWFSLVGGLVVTLLPACKEVLSPGGKELPDL